jgi:hypothetical protein
LERICKEWIVAEFEAPHRKLLGEHEENQEISSLGCSIYGPRDDIS